MQSLYWKANNGSFFLVGAALVKVETGQLMRSSCTGEESTGVVAALRVHGDYKPSNTSLGFDIAMLMVGCDP